MTLRRLDTGPYGKVLWVDFTTSRKTADKQWEQFGGQPGRFDRMAGVLFANNEGDHMVICVFDGKLSTLVHETAHAVIDLFGYIGMPVNGQTTEAFAFLQEHLFNQCKKGLK